MGRGRRRGGSVRGCCGCCSLGLAGLALLHGKLPSSRHAAGLVLLGLLLFLLFSTGQGFGLFLEHQISLPGRQVGILLRSGSERLLGRIL